MSMMPSRQTYPTPQQAQANREYLAGWFTAPVCDIRPCSGEIRGYGRCQHGANHPRPQS